LGLRQAGAGPEPKPAPARSPTDARVLRPMTTNVTRSGQAWWRLAALPSRSPQSIDFLWRVCMGAQGA
jgi:hypothetical protein